MDSHTTAVYESGVVGDKIFDILHLRSTKDEAPENLYQRLLTYTKKYLQFCNRAHAPQGEVCQENGAMISTLESIIVLLWLHHIHKDLPELVRKRFELALRSNTLASLKPTISQSIDVLIEELQNLDKRKHLVNDIDTEYDIPNKRMTSITTPLYLSCTKPERESIHHQTTSSCNYSRIDHYPGMALSSNDGQLILKERGISMDKEFDTNIQRFDHNHDCYVEEKIIQKQQNDDPSNKYKRHSISDIRTGHMLKTNTVSSNLKIILNRNIGANRSNSSCGSISRNSNNNSCASNSKSIFNSNYNNHDKANNVTRTSNNKMLKNSPNRNINKSHTISMNEGVSSKNIANSNSAGQTNTMSFYNRQNQNLNGNSEQDYNDSISNSYGTYYKSQEDKSESFVNHFDTNPSQYDYGNAGKNNNGTFPWNGANHHSSKTGLQTMNANTELDTNPIPESPDKVAVTQSPFFHAYYQRYQLKITIDSGAETNMIKESIALRIGVTITQSTQLATQADGVSPLAIKGETRIKLTRHSKRFFLAALVVENLDVDILAGVPFMSSNDVAVRPAKQQIIIGDGTTYEYGAIMLNRDSRIKTKKERSC